MISRKRLIMLVRILWGPVTSGAMLLSNHPRPAGVTNMPLEGPGGARTRAEAVDSLPKPARRPLGYGDCCGNWGEVDNASLNSVRPCDLRSDASLQSSASCWGGK